MRDVLKEASGTAPDTPSTEAETDDDDVSMDVWMGTDPFYDRFPWFRLVGRYTSVKCLQNYIVFIEHSYI